MVEHDVPMELDTGAAVSIISEDTFRRISGGKLRIKPCPTKLTSYAGDEIGVVGQTDIDVYIPESSDPHTSRKLPVTGVEGQGQCLIGRNWLEQVQFNR